MNIRAFLSFLLFFVAQCFGIAQSDTALPKDSLAALGDYYLEKSNEVMAKSMDSCIIYTRMAAEYYGKAEKWFDHVVALGGVGGASYYNGQDDQAREYYEKALAASREKLGEELYHVLNGYALLYYKQRGLYEQAIDLLYRAVNNLEERGGKATHKSSILQNISSCFRAMGDFPKAIDYIDQALQINRAERGESHNATIKNRVALASCYRQNGSEERALAMLKEAERLMRPQEGGKYVTNILAQIYTQLGDIYLQKTDYDSTAYYIQEALLFQPDDNSVEKNFSFQVLGQLYLQQAKPEKAITELEEALRLSLLEHQNFPFHPDIAQTYQWLAEAHALMDKREEALGFFQQALSALCPDQPALGRTENPAPSMMTDPAVALSILSAKAGYLEGQGEVDEALTTYAAAMGTIREVRKRFSSQRAKHLLGGQALPVFERAIQLAKAQYDQTNDANFLALAFSFAEQNKSNLLLESLQERLAKGQRILPDSLLDQENRLQVEIAFFKRTIQEEKVGGQTDEAVLDRWKTKLLRLQQEFDALQRQMAQQYPSYYQLKYDYRPATLDEIRSVLPDQKTAFLEYFVGPSANFLFVVTPNAMEMVPLRLPSNIKDQISDFRQLIAGYPTSEQFLAQANQLSELGYALYQILLGNLPVPDQTESLIIAPDDVLNYVPFDALVVQQPTQEPKDFSLTTFEYLLEQYSISYTYSGTLLAKAYSMPQKDRAKGFWVGFAPSFGGPMAINERGCQLNELYSLQCNADEVLSIQEILGGQSLVGDKANKETFQATASDYQIIHLATHACVDLTSGTNNRIFLTDDYLTDADLRLLTLKADLAVLSACNTGTGELLKGEGVLSLARSFAMAGVPGTLTTLWSVDDCTTSDIMKGFYTFLEEGQSKDAAIRAAKIQHLQSAEKVYQHPYFWAAFVPYGNMEAIQQKNGIAPIFLIGIGVVLLLGGFLFLRKRVFSR